MNRTFSLSLTAFFLLAGCSPDNAQTFQGYIENDLTYISSPVAGKINALAVSRGDTIEQDTLLFSLEANPQINDLDNARANVEVALANVRDFEKGARQTQLDEIKAQIEQAKASLDYNEKELMRRQALVESDNIQIDAYDQSVRNVEKSQALLAQYQASLADAKLPARIDQLAAKEAALDAATATLKKATWTLNQKTVTAPLGGIVFDTYYQLGEQVPAYAAVVSLLIPHNTKAITFVPETELSRIRLGNNAHIDCDSCTRVMSGKISFISPTAEYTPPVIYSRDNRSKLVYRVEITFDPNIASQFHPGQPVDVTL